MFKARVVVGFSLALTLIAPGASAQEPEAPGVAVEYVYPTLTLRVGLPTDLQTVLEAICQRTEATCEIAPGAVQVLVSPVDLTGSWREVIATLLEGTNLGYAWTAPVPERGGRLLVLLKSTVASAPPQVGEERKEVRRRPNQKIEASASAEPSSSQPLSPDNKPARPQEAATSPDKSSPGSEAAGFDPSSGSSRRAVQQQPNEEDRPSPAQELAREAAVWSIITGLTAYPNPPESTPGTITLPVPDLNGNPILVPTTSHGLTELPFPDPQGRPIPVTPLPPGQSIPNPFMP